VPTGIAAMLVALLTMVATSALLIVLVLLLYRIPHDTQ
jgi:hypothetical protein